MMSGRDSFQCAFPLLICLFWFAGCLLQSEKGKAPFFAPRPQALRFTALMGLLNLFRKQTSLIESFSSQPSISRYLDSKMASWEHFDVTFQFNRNFAYDKNVLDTIISNRRSLENQLFIDRLLGLMGVKAGMNTVTTVNDVANQALRTVHEKYPPKSNQHLRELYKQILLSSFPNHQKQAVIYYLLRDCRANEALVQFLRRCSIPDKYQLFIDGLWHLDRLEFQVMLT